MEHPVPTLKELKSLRSPIKNAYEEHRKSLTKIQKTALWITEHVGTLGFFIIIFVWTISWLTWNTFGPKDMRFDPFPAFVFWLFISNMIQIMLMPLIMVGQNLQNIHSEKRAESEYEVNIRSSREIEAILMHLENQNDMLKEIQSKLK